MRRRREVLKREARKSPSNRVVDSQTTSSSFKAIERKTGLARTHRLPRAVQPPRLPPFAEVSACSAGRAPPFEVSSGEAQRGVAPFEALRGAVLSSPARASSSPASRASAR
jgi:DNA gyrase subunit B